MPAKLESEPPATARLARLNVTDGSLRVKVMLAVSPILRADLLLTIEMVGASVSMAMGVGSENIVLPLPAASVNELAATVIVPATVEFTAGVNVAV